MALRRLFADPGGVMHASIPANLLKRARIGAIRIGFESISVGTNASWLTETLPIPIGR